jgi:polyhydroxyalkanoate synthesis regulator phasin
LKLFKIRVIIGIDSIKIQKNGGIMKKISLLGTLACFSILLFVCNNNANDTAENEMLHGLRGIFNILDEPLLGDQELQNFENTEEVQPKQYQNTIISPEDYTTITVTPPALQRIQNSKHWKRFVALYSNNGIKTVGELALAIGLVVFSINAFPDTAVVGFALHLLGRFINKHTSAIPYLARIGLVPVTGYFLFSLVDRYLYSLTNFNPFLNAAFVLSGFLASENAIGAKPALNGPIDSLRRKLKEKIRDMGWQFEKDSEVNEFNIEAYVEELIEQSKKQTQQLEGFQSYSSPDRPEIVVERLEKRLEGRVNQLELELAAALAAARTNTATSSCNSDSGAGVQLTPVSRPAGQSANTSLAQQELPNPSGSQSPRSQLSLHSDCSGDSTNSIRSGRSVRSQATLED